MKILVGVALELGGLSPSEAVSPMRSSRGSGTVDSELMRVLGGSSPVSSCSGMGGSA